MSIQASSSGHTWIVTTSIFHEEVTRSKILWVLLNFTSLACMLLREQTLQKLLVSWPLTSGTLALVLDSPCGILRPVRLLLWMGVLAMFIISCVKPTATKHVGLATYWNLKIWNKKLSLCNYPMVVSILDVCLTKSPYLILTQVLILLITIWGKEILILDF